MQISQFSTAVCICVRGHLEKCIGLVIHFDIHNGKVWIQYNGTKASLAKRPVDLGVPPLDIVIGFHSPFKRQFTGYADNVYYK